MLSPNIGLLGYLVNWIGIGTGKAAAGRLDDDSDDGYLALDFADRAAVLRRIKFNR